MIDIAYVLDVDPGLGDQVENDPSVPGMLWSRGADSTPGGVNYG